jgi:hypothetical protein
MKRRHRIKLGTGQVKRINALGGREGSNCSSCQTFREVLKAGRVGMATASSLEKFTVWLLLTGRMSGGIHLSLCVAPVISVGGIGTARS